MPQLSYRTAGESHGPALTILVEGFPADMPIDLDLINAELKRRQGGYGRGGRMRIEKDAVTFLAGVRRNVTMGGPIVMQIVNRDSRLDDTPEINRPRPGHADLAGSLKWLTTDCRNTLERASARETAGRVAAGALCKCLLRHFGIECVGFVIEVGGAKATVAADLDANAIIAARDANDVYTPDATAVAAMETAIHEAKKAGDTVGGIVEVRVFGLPPGLGSCASSQDKLDGRLMQAVGSIQAFKGVEIGIGFDAARLPGSKVHDAIVYDAAQRNTHNLGFARRGNNAGGLEGGMTTGQTLVVRGVMKPIATLLQGMDSVNLKTLVAERSDYERSDVCAVPAASVVAESAVTAEIARALLDKFGGDTLGEVRRAFDGYLRAARALAP
ncbi:MAG: chorismate synthase [Phycisphaerae bacterium]